MGRKMTQFLLALMLCSFVTSVVHAEDVFVTKHGKKYHKADSRFLKGKEAIKMTREEAEAKGYTPDREFLGKSEGSNQTDKSQKIQKSGVSKTDKAE